MYKVNDEDDSFNNLVLAGDENFESLGTLTRPDHERFTISFKILKEFTTIAVCKKY